ncbi:MAG: hypothetical protein IT462_09625 [Planctomycetes bacterium]|nr:hypothetical protein [Planctomycetota bacterium]
MDDREYRRLCVDALRGRLDDVTRQRWEAHGRANPECARFFAQLAASDAGAATRMTSAPVSAPPLAMPADEEEAARADTRRLAYWGPVAVLVGALVAGVGALLIFGPDPGSRGKAISLDRTNQPREIDERDHIPEKSSDGSAQNVPVTSATNVPTQPERPPVKLPVHPQPTQPETPPTTPQPVKPEIVPETPPVVPTPTDPVIATPPAPVAFIGAVGGKDPRYRLQSAAGAPRFLSESANLARGDRVRLMSGSIDVAVDGLKLQCTERAEFRVVTAADRPLGVQFDYGTYVADGVNLEEPRVVALEHARLELRRAAIMVRADWGQTSICVLQGEIGLSHDNATQVLREGDSALIEPGRISVPAPGKIDWEAMDNLWLGSREILLRAGFDNGLAPFDIGVQQAPGARHSAGALAWDKARPGVGCSEKGPVFTPAANSRLRFRVKTNSPQLRVQVQVMIDEKWQTVVIPLIPAASAEWQLFDLPLSDLRTGPNDSQDGFVVGAEHRALQFRYRYPDKRILPSERFLLVDDVEVYTPLD